MHPFALRLRTLQPLIDGDGTCSLVYDVERAAVFEVPEDLQLHLEQALERGDLDDLLGWLTSEDLLTAESWEEWAGGRQAHAASGHRDWAARVVGHTAGAAGLAALAHGCEEGHGWIDRAPEALAIEELDMVFRRGSGCSRLKLHLDWVGTFPADGLLERVVAEARCRATASGQEVSFELALDPDQVTPEVASRLAAQPMHVRLRCGESSRWGQEGTPHETQPWLLAEPAVKLLLAHPPLSAALTIQCVLDGPSRLIELWRWAAALGIRSLDVIRLEETYGGRAATTSAAWLREYRQDLFAILEETCRELEAGRLPIELQPLTRMVRRLVRNEPLAGMIAAGDERLMPEGPPAFPGMASLDPRQLPEVMWLRLEQSPDRGRLAGHDGGESTDGPWAAQAPEMTEGLESAEPAAARFPCKSCWARRVCSHSAFVASPLGGEDPREPSRERCSFWFAEVEMAIRLYYRLGQIDALQVLRFLHAEPGLLRSPVSSVWRRAPFMPIC